MCFSSAPIEEETVEGLMRMVQFNQLVTFLCMQAALTPLRAAGGDSIANL